MRISESCAACLYDKQAHRSEDPEFLNEIRSIIDNRTETDVSAYLVYQFNQAFERRFGRKMSYEAVKREYNDLVLSMETALREKIEKSPDPLATALVFARIGNYIDFGAMNHVDKDVFLGLFADTRMSRHDEETFRSFLKQCKTARKFLLVADNCGEIVLDKLLIEQMQKAFPEMSVTVMVRGGEVLNDATAEDAAYTGIDSIARVVSNGLPIAGTVYGLLSPEGRQAIDDADLILAKGQGNYESMSAQGRHVFYLFLCKCDLFTSRFGVPRLTGMFVEENTDAIQLMSGRIQNDCG